MLSHILQSVVGEKCGCIAGASAVHEVRTRWGMMGMPQRSSSRSHFPALLDTSVIYLRFALLTLLQQQ